MGAEPGVRGSARLDSRAGRWLSAVDHAAGGTGTVGGLGSMGTFGGGTTAELFSSAVLTATTVGAARSPLFLMNWSRPSAAVIVNPRMGPLNRGSRFGTRMMMAVPKTRAPRRVPTRSNVR